MSVKTKTTTKVKWKRYFIVKEKKTMLIKHLTWKESEEARLASKFYWPDEDTAEIYKDYLNTRKMEE